MAETTRFDARCHACGRTHIVRVQANEKAGATIKTAHNTGYACGEYAEHTLLGELVGLGRDLTAR